MSRRVLILPVLDSSETPIWRLPDPRVPLGLPRDSVYEFALMQPTIPCRIVSAWIDVPMKAQIASGVKP